MRVSTGQTKPKHPRLIGSPITEQATWRWQSNSLSAPPPSPKTRRYQKRGCTPRLFVKYNRRLVGRLGRREAALEVEDLHLNPSFFPVGGGRRLCSRTFNLWNRLLRINCRLTSESRSSHYFWVFFCIISKTSSPGEAAMSVKHGLKVEEPPPFTHKHKKQFN